MTKLTPAAQKVLANVRLRVNDVPHGNGQAQCHREDLVYLERLLPKVVNEARKMDERPPAANELLDALLALARGCGLADRSCHVGDWEEFRDALPSILAEARS